MRIKTKHYNIPLDLKEPLCLAFVSDLHDSPNAPILREIEKAKVDGIVVGGDVIHNSKLYERGIEFLKSAVKLAPVFVSLGNHEICLKTNIRQLIRETGAILLDNDDTYFHGIRIGGLTSGRFYDEDKPNLEWLEAFSKKDGYKLLLCHHPEYFKEYIEPFDIDLVLSGHAHGGHWRIFGRGVFAPQQGLFPKYTSGMYHERLIVGTGLGNKELIPRINNPYEIIILKMA